MAGNVTKRIKKKTKISSKGFKRAFPFIKQDQQQKCLQSQHTNVALLSSAIASNESNRYSVQSDDETSTCSSTIDVEGVLIFPNVRRLTQSSPPLALFDSMPGLNRQSSIIKGSSFLSLTRRRCSSRATSLSSSAPPILQTRSPYQSKKEQNNLPATLKRCRSKSDAKHLSINYSAWELRQSTSTRRRHGNSFSRIAEAHGVLAETRDSGIDIIQTGSSGSLFLPAEVSPANRFVPIGFEEDYVADSFDSNDYDICKVPMSEDNDENPPAETLVANVTVTPIIPIFSSADLFGSDDEDDSVHQQDLSSAPGLNDISLVGSDRSSTNSDETPRLESHRRSSSNELIREKGQRHQKQGRYHVDKYCAPMEYEDDDWFPQVKEEIMKLSSFFASNCGSNVGEIIN